MKRNVTFGVVGAMDSEVATLRSLLMRDGVPAFTETAYAGLTFYGGGIGGNRVVLVKSGIGKVNAARCTQILIDRYTPITLSTPALPAASARDSRSGMSSLARSSYSTIST